MRRVTAGLFHSVDGVVESPNLFQFDSFDPELGAGMTDLITQTTTVLLGRTGYDEWSGYWPNASRDDPFAAFINPVEKLVASRTLTGPLSWQNSRLLEGDLLDAVLDLKSGDGEGDIAVCASISIVRQLLFAELLDSLLLMTHPVVAGTGRRLFEAGDPVTRLTLLDSTSTSAGNVLSRYAVRPDA